MPESLSSRLKLLTRGQVVGLVVLFVCGSIGAWLSAQQLSQQIFADQRATFEEETRQFTRSLRDRLIGVESVLDDVEAYFAASQDVATNELVTFVGGTQERQNLRRIRATYFIPPEAAGMTVATSSHRVVMQNTEPVVLQNVDAANQSELRGQIERIPFRDTEVIRRSADTNHLFIFKRDGNALAHIVSVVHIGQEPIGIIGAKTSLQRLYQQGKIRNKLGYDVQVSLRGGEQTRVLERPADQASMAPIVHAFGIEPWTATERFKLADSVWTISFTTHPGAHQAIWLQLLPVLLLVFGELLVALVVVVAVLLITNHARAKQRAERMTRRMRRLAHILNVTPDFVATATPDGDAVYINKSGRQMLGLEEQEDVVRNRVRDNHPRWAVEKIMNEGFPEARENGFWRGELALLDKHGNEVPMDQILMAHYDDNGELAYYSTIARDISDRKKLEEKLQIRNRALESTIDGVVITDPNRQDNPIIYANQAFLDLTGYSEDEVLGVNCRFLQQGDRDPEKLRRIREAIEAREPIRIQLRNFKKDGTMFWNELTISPVFDDDNELIYFVGVQHDVTDIVETKNELAREKAQDEAILGSLGEGLMVTNQEGQITFVNDAFETLMRCDCGEVQHKHVSEVVPITTEDGEDVSFEADILSPMISGESDEFSERTYFFTRSDGSSFPVALTVSPIELDGQYIGGVAVFRDTTRERQIDQAKNEFVSLASHQLRTPLSTINWYAEMLLSGDAGKVTKAQKEFLEQVYQSSQRMVELVNALLNVSRIELGKLAVNPEPTQLDEVAASVLEEMRPSLEAKNQEVKREIADDIPEIKLDPSLIRIAYQNLLSNAHKYTPEGEQLGIVIHRVQQGDVIEGVEVEHDGVLSVVWDHGYGIPKEDHDKVFSKMFRADNVKERDTTGTGLGLYIAKAVVNGAGGQMWFTSAEGQGTTFFFTIPLEGMSKREGTKGLIMSDYNGS